MHKSMRASIQATAVHSTRSNLSRAAPYSDLHPIKRFTFTCVISFCAPRHCISRLVLQGWFSPLDGDKLTSWIDSDEFASRDSVNFNLLEECRTIAHWMTWEIKLSPFETFVECSVESVLARWCKRRNSQRNACDSRPENVRSSWCWLMPHVTRSCNEPFMIIYQSRYENLSKVELFSSCTCDLLNVSHILMAQQNFALSAMIKRK